MKFDHFLQLFVVKERKFYPLFINLGLAAKEAADKLLLMSQCTDPEEQARLYQAVKSQESLGDSIESKIYSELLVTFVTPFDREDINHLNSQLDTFIDFIHDSARKILMYKPVHLNDNFVSMARLIQRDAEIICELMTQLEFIRKKSDYIRSLCGEIKAIEHQADFLYEQIMSGIFSNENDAIKLVKLKNIVQALEDTTDKAQTVGVTLRNILVKTA